jgi:TRAP-type C4-dicarboxylate transport system permease small subunit
MDAQAATPTYCGRLAAWSLRGAAVALLALAIVQGWQVFARYVLDAAPSWSEPYSLLLLNVLMMLGAASAVHAEAHFGFFVAVENASPTLRRLLQAFARLVVAGIGVLLASWGVILVMDGWDVPVAGAPLSQGTACLPLALGGALITLFAVERLVLGLRQPVAPEAR